ncbi:MAG: ATP-binding protein [Candidatus Hodarchaeota archaeon]
MTSAHEKLRQRLEEFPIPCVEGKGIIEFLKLAYTEREAEILSMFKSFQKFLTVEEFARENNLNVDEVQDVFYSLAKRNLIRFEKKSSEEKFCIHPFVAGVFEAFFSAWKYQDPEKLLPAAQLLDEYFVDAFHKAASNSRSPWARVMPSINAIGNLLEKYPELEGGEEQSEKTVMDHVTKTTGLLKYGAKEVGRRIASGGFNELIDFAKSDGHVIVNSVAEGIASFLGFNKKPPRKQEKVIQVGESVPAKLMVHPFEVIKNYIDQASEIIVTTCSCRKKGELLDSTRSEGEKQNCKHPVEGSCMQIKFEGEAHEYNMWGGRVVSKEEALKILLECEKSGLVHTSFNSIEDIGFICNCCPCCCGILGTLTRFNQKHAAFVESNYIPYLATPEKCIACGTCASRCPVNAILQEGEKQPIVDSSKCIGCGLCVSSCPKGVLELKRTKDQRPAMDMLEAHVKFANDKLI